MNAVAQPLCPAGGRPATALRGPSGVRRFAFVLLPGFDALTLSAANAPLRTWNRVAGGTCCAWDYYTAGPDPVSSTDGWTLPARPVDAAIWQADHVLVVGGPAPQKTAPALPALIRTLWRRGKIVTGLQGGVFVLAQSGILQSRKVAVHSEQIPVFSTLWPELDPRAELYCIDGRLQTCAGGAAAADLMIQSIRDLGQDLRPDVVKACSLAGHRPEGVLQSVQPTAHLPRKNPVLVQAVAWLHDHYLSQGCIAGVTRATGVSARHLQRLFRDHLRTTPSAYVAELRVRRAVSLLGHTNLSIAEVAASCGYDTTSRFTKTFRSRMGAAPSKYIGMMAAESPAGMSRKGSTP